MMSDSFMIKEFFAIDLHFGAGPFAEQHEVAGLTSGTTRFAVLVSADLCNVASPSCGLLDGIGNDDAAGCFDLPGRRTTTRS